MAVKSESSNFLKTSHGYYEIISSMFEKAEIVHVDHVNHKFVCSILRQSAIN